MLTIIAGRLRGVGESLEFLIVRRVKLTRLKNSRQVSAHRDGPARQAADLTLLLRVLTDRGSEYCWAIEPHEYQLYLAAEDQAPVMYGRKRCRSILRKKRGAVRAKIGEASGWPQCCVMCPTRLAALLYLQYASAIAAPE